MLNEEKGINEGLKNKGKKKNIKKKETFKMNNKKKTILLAIDCESDVRVRLDVNGVDKILGG